MVMKPLPPPLPENKTERLHVLVAPSELTAVDEWARRNSVRTRGEAVRKLIGIGLSLELPNRVFDQIVASATLNDRSFQDELVQRLTDSFGTEDRISISIPDNSDGDLSQVIQALDNIRSMLVKSQGQT